MNRTGTLTTFVKTNDWWDR